MKLYSDCLKNDKDILSPQEIAEKIYLIYNSYVFRGKEDLQYVIYKLISEHFKIPITSIQLCGSGKTGYSYYKSKKFDAISSDLDIAIISSSLFNFYLEKTLLDSEGLQNTYFIKRDNKKSYMSYLSKGWLRPDFMPDIPLKTDWFTFFGSLSNKYTMHFAKINAGIFLSEMMFNYQQKSIVDFYWKTEQFALDADLPIINE